MHGGGFASYHDARKDRIARLDELHKRWNDEHARLKALTLTMQQQAKISPDLASRYRAMATRLAKFEEAGPPPDRPEEQNVTMRLAGGRTGIRAVIVEQLELTGLMQPFDCEISYGERVAVLGGNGSGKSHFLRLLAGEDVQHTGYGTARRAGRRRAGSPRPTSTPSCSAARSSTSSGGTTRWTGARAWARCAATSSATRPTRSSSHSPAASRPGSRSCCSSWPAPTLLLLDEPTDNLDLASAEALEDGLAAFDGTVMAVTHDRWFARGFDRFLHFGSDGEVYEDVEPHWDERRPVR